MPERYYGPLRVQTEEIPMSKQEKPKKSVKKSKKKKDAKRDALNDALMEKEWEADRLSLKLNAAEIQLQQIQTLVNTLEQQAENWREQAQSHEARLESEQDIKKALLVMLRTEQENVYEVRQQLYQEKRRGVRGWWRGVTGQLPEPPKRPDVMFFDPDTMAASDGLSAQRDESE